MACALKQSLVTQRVLLACLGLLAAVLLPVGPASAQDYEAVERKLGEAVAEGHLTLKQAAIMMEALRESGDDDKEHEVEERIERWIDETGERIRLAVEEGGLTEQEGWDKWFAFKEKELMPKLEGVLKEGLVTEEWVAALKRGLKEAEVGERLKAAVRRGDMTEEEAWAKWEAMQEQWEQQRQWKSQAAEPWLEESLERFEREIADRTPDENHREMEALVRFLDQAKRAGNEDRVKILSIEIKMIKEALEKASRDKQD